MYAAMVKRASGSVLERRPTSASTPFACAIRSRPKARTVLLVLLAASGLVFIIACSNVANLILARTVRREGELAIRAALGASRGALRRTLLAESLLLCGAGALLGVLIARPMVAILARYASRFSVRALDLTVDSSMLWVGAGLAIVAAVLLAFVPRLPSADASQGIGLASGGVRITGSTNRRLRIFAVTQIAASFVLLAGASMLLKTLLALQAVRDRLRHAPRARHQRACDVLRQDCRPDHQLLSGNDSPHSGTSRRGRSGSAARCPGATPAASARASSSPAEGHVKRHAKKIRARTFAPFRPDFSPRSACPSSQAATSTTTIAAAASLW